MTSTRPKKPKLGRPAREKRVSHSRLVARCTFAELEEAATCAGLQGCSLSDFVREAVEAHVAAYHAGRDVRSQTEHDKSARGTSAARRLRKALDAREVKP